MARGPIESFQGPHAKIVGWSQSFAMGPGRVPLMRPDSKAPRKNQFAWLLSLQQDK